MKPNKPTKQLTEKPSKIRHGKNQKSLIKEINPITKTTIRQQQIGEAEDILDAIGHERESEGIKWTKYFMDMYEKKQLKKDQFNIEALKKNKMSKSKYSWMLKSYLEASLSRLEIPNTFQVKVEKTHEGIVAMYKPVYSSRWRYKAFAPCGIPLRDYKHVLYIIQEIDLSILKEDNSPVTDTGIILPRNPMLNDK